MDLIQKERFKDFLEEFNQNKIAVVSLYIIIIIVLVSVFCTVIAPFDPYDLTTIHLENSALPPLSKERLPNREKYNITLTNNIITQDNDDIISRYKINTLNNILSLNLELKKPVSEKIVIKNLPLGTKLLNGTQNIVNKTWTVNIETGQNIELRIQGNIKTLSDKKIEILLIEPIKYTGKLFLLGTDGYGRDLFSAILYGMRVSLYTGLVSGIISLCIGVFIGLFSAWRGGKVDAFFMRIVDLQQSFPAVLIGILLVGILGKGLNKMILTLVIVQWSFYVRTVRSIVMVEQNKDYIKMCRVLGLPTRKILLNHLLPNCIPQIIVLATVRIAAAITLESTLSFLGLGLPPSRPSLGLLIAQGYDFMLSGKFWISLYPGFALLLLIMSVNIVGEHIKLILNPYSRR